MQPVMRGSDVELLCFKKTKTTNKTIHVCETKTLVTHFDYNLDSFRIQNF